MQQEKEFDRSVCFTFFGNYYKQIKLIQEEYGKEKAYDICMAIIEYGLFETEIEDNKTRIMIGETTLSLIDESQKRRARGFKGEDLEKTKLVTDYYHDHPEASQNEIAKMTGVSKGKVNKVIRKIKEESSISSDINIDTDNDINNSYDNNTMTATVTDKSVHVDDSTLNETNLTITDKFPIDLFEGITQEQVHKAWEMFQDEHKYNEIHEITNIPRKKLKSIIDYGIKFNFKTPLDQELEEEEKMKPIPLTPAEQELFGKFY